MKPYADDMGEDPDGDLDEQARLSDRIIFGKATTRRLRINHRPERVGNLASGYDQHGRPTCDRCGIAIVRRRRFVPGRMISRDIRLEGHWTAYWQHVPRGRQVTP